MTNFRYATDAKYREAAKQKARIWRINNPVLDAEKERRRRAKRNPRRLLGCLLRSRLCHAVKNGQKAGSAVRDLGCSIAEFREWITSKFRPGMTWENYGHGGWHFDHVLPLSSFDLTDRKQFLQAVHFTNLQPLWASDNYKKGSRT